MYCWYCKHPLVVPSIDYRRDTKAINDHVRVAEQEVKCGTCGAEFTVETFGNKAPKLAPDTVKRLENRAL
jgi:hypothetical protein